MAGTPYTSIYEDLFGVLTTATGVTWKYDHEYMIYLMEMDGDWELGCVYMATIESTLRVIDRGFLAVTMDAWVVFDRQTMQIKTESRKGNSCPIIKILERPLTKGVSDFTSENWEEYYTGPALAQVNINWEDDYEYLVYTSITEPPGRYADLKWQSCCHFFCPSAMSPSDINGGGYLKPIEGASGVMMYRGRFSSPTGRHIRRFDKGDGLISNVLRRKIRTDTQPTVNYNSWKIHVFSLPNGVQAGGNWRDAKPFNWPEDKELMIASQDPKGSTEIGTSYFVTDSNALKAQRIPWRDRGLAYAAGYDHYIELLKSTWQGRGTKHIRSSDGRIYAAWEKLDVLDTPPPEPPPPVPPPVESCFDCVVAGTLWEQTAEIEVRFVKPSDWQLRNYKYEWHGDIGNGSVELVSVKEGGRIAKIRVVKTLAQEDDMQLLPVNIAVTVSDLDYALVGIEDTDTALIEFEMPCIVVANDPEITIEDITVDELDNNHVVQVTVSLSEPVTGAPITVDWETRDGTANSDLSVRSLAKDDLGLPFITAIESLDGNVRTYIDGCFPKWYAASFHNRLTVPKYQTTYLFTQNLINWLSKTKTGGPVLLLGDKLDSPYNVKNPNANDFFPVFSAAASATGRSLVVEYVYDVVPSKAYFDGFDCIIYVGSHYTDQQVNTPEFISALVESHLGGTGFAAISDHGVDDITGTGFFKGVNEILIDAFGVGLKGSIDREAMMLTVENAKANQGNHPLWAGLSGQIDAGGSEAYVDAIDSEPDYVSGSGTLNFAVGDQTKIIEVTIIGDEDIENQEYFEIQLSNNNRGVLVKDVGRVTINDDDAQPCGVTTGAGGAGVTETVHFMGSSSGVVTVSFDMYGVPDMMEIFYEGVRVAATSEDLSRPYPSGSGRYYNLPNGNKDLPTEVSGAGSLSFFYEGPPAKSSNIMIRMSGPSGTAWTYDLGCPVPAVTVEGGTGGGSGGGGGGDCFKFGTLVRMSDDFEKEIEDLVVGDEVKTFSIVGLTDASDEAPVDYLEWSTYDLMISEGTAKVVSISFHEHDYYHEIFIEGCASPMCVTEEHPILVKYGDRNDWIFDNARYLKSGDRVLNEFGQQVSVISNQTIFRKIKTANLNVETLDTYFAGGILVHNKDTNIQQ